MLHFLLIILVVVVIWRLLRGGGISNASMYRFARVWLIGAAVVLVAVLMVVFFVEILPRMPASTAPVAVTILGSAVLLCLWEAITR